MLSKMHTEAGVPAVPGLSSSSENPHKKPKKAEDKTGAPPSRFSLRMSAAWWRSLQCIGMTLHYLAPPRPPNPAFSKSISATISSKKGNFTLQFYTPKGYDEAKKTRERFPAVVNFHGGGFTLGNATDDARFARFVLETCNAIFISVDYRLAPEYPFPTAVDDGADALLYLIRYAPELYIDPYRLATSGFSAGGNIAITSPLRLTAHLKTITASTAPGQEQVPVYRIVAIATWYPICDYTLSRVERRATAIRPDQTLPPGLTTLFDSSYLFPPNLDLADPCLSPSKATDQQLAEGIPPNVIFYTCEWDMLLREGEDLAKRLERPPISKNVHYRMIEGVPHGWDKGPDPLKPPAHSEQLYLECCERLRDVFNGAESK
ncbi:Alpha/Beta hydrolase protein [Diplogelasinospora grovesii]|uniref:Alpha/Beta hydrolase protein n=1 Tax=Diplogelasinospora grovesii TaxID=303347 RepID=A0AAN6S2C5_9PEZI|nr:Alpha/Beta hydrolase protein [Diplogelasinospora grovesii]